jgi:hypothetical protein
MMAGNPRRGAFQRCGILPNILLPRPEPGSREIGPGQREAYGWMSVRPADQLKAVGRPLPSLRRFIMIDRELQKHFGFDEADLFANRSGVLTSKQRKRLEGDAKFANRLFLIIGIVIFGIGILPSMILLFTKASKDFLILWSSLWIPICSFFGIIVIRLGSPKKMDFELKNVEGKINIVKEENYNYTTNQATIDYELHIGRVTFDVESDLADIMRQGDTYAIYYLKGIKEIISAEKIESKK